MTKNKHKDSVHGLVESAYKFRRFDRDCTCPGLLRELADKLEAFACELDERDAEAEHGSDQRAPKMSGRCTGCAHYGYKDPGDGKGWCKHPGAPQGEVVRHDDHCADYEAWQVPTEERKTLPWVYCECGCKGWELSIGGLYFWMFWDLNNGWYVGTQHGRVYANHKFNSAPDAETFVLAELAKALPKLQQDHQVITELLAKHPQQQGKA